MIAPLLTSATMEKPAGKRPWLSAQQRSDLEFIKQQLKGEIRSLPPETRERLNRSLLANIPTPES